MGRKNRIPRDGNGRDAIAMTSATAVMEIRGSVRLFWNDDNGHEVNPNSFWYLLRDTVPEASQAPRHIDPCFRLGQDSAIRMSVDPFRPMTR